MLLENGSFIRWVEWQLFEAVAARKDAIQTRFAQWLIMSKWPLGQLGRAAEEHAVLRGEDEGGQPGDSRPKRGQQRRCDVRWPAAAVAAGSSSCVHSIGCAISNGSRTVVVGAVAFERMRKAWEKATGMNGSTRTTMYRTGTTYSD